MLGESSISEYVASPSTGGIENGSTRSTSSTYDSEKQKILQRDVVSRPSPTTRLRQVECKTPTSFGTKPPLMQSPLMISVVIITCCVVQVHMERVLIQTTHITWPAKCTREPYPLVPKGHITSNLIGGSMVFFPGENLYAKRVSKRRKYTAL